jgi:GNAT superfamily N-acetyltransferase
VSFTISDLRERPEFFDIIADRIWRAWWERQGVLLGYIEARLRENLAGPGVPLALVAHDAPGFLGTASLIASDLDERPQYTPWVAAVWTEPVARGRGVARALLARARDEAFRLGHQRVHLCARPAMQDYYLALGWKPIEARVGPLQLTVYACDRSA